ncbi:thioredoxin domain-containing protein [Nocardioides sp. SYSU D00038]|uniref:thioredoxin domain-containing protein n=1 Tax=Nocardioides sp. SYSU D00038 TaxID=2812554 RepID=UPI00196864BF|nr:thioredoxin domain-containing protein [Nocardioides sp. SYSU D00038]
MPNRLAQATSPYLLQHRDNPVDWWEWGPEAFAEARERNVPVLLSVGYAACHWCHVMAHESFEDEATAAYLNEHYVSIKVDREERPDVDAVYMQATVAMTEHGGWPMTCVLDHDGNPFFAGTYFPDRPRHGQPSFRQVLEALVDAWRTKGDDVQRIAATLREHLNRDLALAPGAFTPEVLEQAVATLGAEHDAANGGFGTAPKFPPSMVLEFLRRVPGDQPRAMLDRALEAMAAGGIHDQLGGGFARYSVDASWTVPHFEKMLYDNAQLLGLYARVGDPLGERVARDTAEFLLRELRTPEGGFASALDADTEGEEGRFYVWTPAQLTEVLGEDDGAWAAEVYTVTDTGTFEHGTSVLQLLRPPDDADRLERVRRRLLEAREERVRPERDEKVVAAWNGLAITGLVDAGLRLGEPRWVEAAVAAGELLTRVHLDDAGRLLRVSRDGVAGRHAGVLDDHGCVAAGFLSLLEATGDPVWLDRARLLLDAALTRFRADDGGFFDTAADAEVLVARPRDPSDNASPSGLSSTVHALVAAHAVTGEGRYRDAAEEALASVATLAAQAPRFAGWSLAAAATMVDGPLEVAVVGPAGAERDALADRARRHPGAVVLVADGPDERVPLLAGRAPVGGRAAAYVCRGFVCERPVTEVDDLAHQLAPA